ncbi:MAG: ATP-binding cassette domain-containing protein [Streptosporangiales bacterium]|nr:ATP-binding cassette domain-containing protein [Streptosporangiales bacterium]
MSTAREVVLRATGLTKRFTTRRNVLGRAVERLTAVEDVSFELRAGKTLALVGESGSGKSTTARLVTALEKPDAGTVEVCGTEWTALGRSALRRERRRMQMVFQDPYASLDPTKMVVHTVGEPLLVHEGVRGQERDRRVADLLERVGLSARHLHRYPYEFSGGQRQRIAIARALAAGPDIIVADEAVSALDVSTQAQVLNLLLDLQRDSGLAFLFISHDLGVVRQVADHVAVMHRGRLVESGPADEIYESPREAYTKSLLAAVPEVSPSRRRERAGLVTESSTGEVVG